VRVVNDRMHFAMFQRWGHPVQMSESILVYVLISMTVFVFCWFGSELSHQESITEPKSNFSEQFTSL
jgi:hypothetical protein